MQCDRGGRYRSRHRAEDFYRQRTTSSRKIECPFSLTITESHGNWYIKIRNPNHNHEPSLSDFAHLVYRHQDLQQESVMEIIETHQRAGLTALQSLTTL